VASASLRGQQATQLCLEEPKTSNGRIRVHFASRNAKLSIERHNSPRFQVWSDVYFQHVSRRIKRSDILERTLRIVLKFWGARPIEDEPLDPNTHYYDLHLVDPIDDPSWLERFEKWMAASQRDCRSPLTSPPRWIPRR
jgi:hypothetical protein